MHDHEHGHDHDHGHEHDHGHGHEHHHDHKHSHGDGCCGGHGHEGHEDTATRSHTHFITEHHHTPGHPDDCACEQCNPHAEYCDICGESLAKCTCKMPDEHLEKRVYILEGIDCANCAAKVEARLKEMDGIDDVSITFATKQMKLPAKDPDSLIPRIQSLIDSMEDGITVIPKDAVRTEGSEKKEGLSEEKKAILSIAAGAVLFVAGEILEHTGAPLPALLGVLVAAYLILGGKVLLTAARNMMKGQVFDENFLMSIATLGAFAIAEYPEAVGVMLFYRIGEYFEDRAVAQSRDQIMSAVDLRPETVNLVVGEDLRVIGAGEANVGDILLVRPGDRIPLDGVIIEGESRVDTSPVTGEPVPVKAGVGDNVVSGCVNTSGQLVIRVEKLLEESMVTRILDSVENAAANKPAIDKFITRFARVYTPAVVAAALVVAVGLPFLLPSWHFFVDPGYTGAVSAIPDAVKIARTTKQISWQNVYFALAVKFVVMVMGLFGFANMWIAVFADTGVSMLCLLNSVRILREKHERR